MKQLLLILFLSFPLLGFSQIYEMKIINTDLSENSKCFDVELTILSGHSCTSYASTRFMSEQKNVHYKVFFYDICFPRSVYTYTDYIRCGLNCTSSPNSQEGCVVTIEGKD